MGPQPTDPNRRALHANVNLVPMIDLLSVLITFLVATAVLIELSSLPVDQEYSDSAPRPPLLDPPPPPLTVHLTADSIGIGRYTPGFARLPQSDWSELDRALADDRARFARYDDLVLVTDDGVPYGHMIHALDLARKHGYRRSMLGGGPALEEL